ncbi:MAG: methionine--tRNA ligase [Acidobacteriota bacterium]|nr:methionine--tRNA ligase [Acidobacteriota bacterium]
MKTFYVTTPIYYANARLHLGHLYTTIVADTLKRYKRQRGYDVFFLTGTDEHGVNIERAAQQRGVPVMQHVDEVVAETQQIFPQFGLEYDHWIRTTADYHYRGAQELWRRIRDAGYIYKSDYAGWYCPNCNEFKADATQEQPVCDVHERLTEIVQEESYFFRLSAFEQRLLQHYEANPSFIQPDARRNEVVSFVRSGLRDISISRTSVRWGVPVPDDPKHVMYVWFEALSNYITALGFGSENTDRLRRYWPADVQLIGKDIIRFHAVWWPAFLMAAGLELPKMIFAHGMLLSGGRKMSKTLGNVIDLPTLKRYFANDMIRYFCLREIVFGEDGDCTFEALIDRSNADLADGFGNLCSRTLTMIKKYCDSVIPAAAQSGDQEQEIRAKAEQARRAFLGEFDTYRFNRALESAWELITRVDKYISENKPWELVKRETGHAQLVTLLNTASKTLRYLAVLLSPVLPEATRQLWQQMGLSGEPAGVDPEALEFDAPIEGCRIGEVRPLFPKLNKEKIMTAIEAERETTGEPVATPPQAAVKESPPAQQQYISIEDFAKVDLRVGTVLTARKVEKTDKLLLLTVDIGEATPRQLLAGIAQAYEPESLIGRKVVVVANLQPRKVRGYESQGMIVAASVGDEERPVLVGFHEDVPNGARLR